MHWLDDFFATRQGKSNLSVRDQYNPLMPRDKEKVAILKQTIA